MDPFETLDLLSGSDPPATPMRHAVRERQPSPKSDYSDINQAYQMDYSDVNQASGPCLLTSVQALSRHGRAVASVHVEGDLAEHMNQLGKQGCKLAKEQVPAHAACCSVGAACGCP